MASSNGAKLACLEQGERNSKVIYSSSEQSACPLSRMEEVEKFL